MLAVVKRERPCGRKCLIDATLVNGLSTYSQSRFLKAYGAILHYAPKSGLSLPWTLDSNHSVVKLVGLNRARRLIAEGGKMPLEDAVKLAIKED